MLITFCLSLIVAKILRYKVTPLFRSWTIYPLLAAEIIHVFFQVNVFLGNYHYVQYASILKTTYMLLFVIPMIVYRLYWPGITGSGLVLAGTALNQFVIWQNGGKMPVFPSLSYWTGYVKPEAFDNVSTLHVLGSAANKYWFLADFIDIGFCILSIGDILIHSYAFLILLFTIKELNSRILKNKPSSSSEI